MLRLNVYREEFMLMQVLDADYVMLNNKPLVRIFGKTKTGETLCALCSNHLPYFYVHVDEQEKLTMLAALMQKNFNVEAEAVEKTLPIGFNKPIKVLKIIGKDPSKVPEMKEYASRFGTPYEADILFVYRFMVDHKLKGMSWVDVSGRLVSTDTVKCRSLDATNFQNVDMIENAPLKHLSIDIECLAAGAPNPKQDQIIIISMCFSPSYRGKDSLVLVAKPHMNGSNVLGCENEKELIKKFYDIVQEYDPDTLIGYNINNYDLPHIIARAEHHELPLDFGRTEKTAYVKKFQGRSSVSVRGRVVVDPYEILKHDPRIKFKRYDLRTVAKEFLGIEKLEMGGLSEIKKLWNGSIDDTRKLVEYAARDSELAMKLVLNKNLLDKFFELAKVSGLLLQDTFGGQSQRLECKLLHAFRGTNYIMPCKPDARESAKRNTEREKLGLKGALVLEPAAGLHAGGCTVVLDFKSLYPSIINMFNICPTTILLDNTLKGDGNIPYIISPYGSRFVQPDVRAGVLPKIVKELVETRAEVKRLAKSEPDWEKRRILNAKQYALKDLSNSLYGYTGYVRSRLYVLDIANTITAFGRDNIIKTKELVEKKFGTKVLYADTDSIFLKTDITDLEAAQKFGEDVAAYVTANMAGLELQFEKIYKTFLILTKKRYAGLVYEKMPVNGNFEWRERIDMKGIETVRRDWCTLTSETMADVLDILLREQDVKKAIAHIRAVMKELSEEKVPLEKLTIVKGITKTPESYDGIQPHAELAKKIRQRDPSRGSLIGERLGYVIVKGNTMLSKRAEEPSYVESKGLQVDAQYYIENQLLPPLLRIFETFNVTKMELIEGLKQKSLSEMLNGKILSPDKTILNASDSVACGSCSWNFHRPPLSGVCPQCGAQVYFSHGGMLGKFLKIQ